RSRTALAEVRELHLVARREVEIVEATERARDEHAHRRGRGEALPDRQVRRRDAQAEPRDVPSLAHDPRDTGGIAEEPAAARRARQRVRARPEALGTARRAVRETAPEL